MEEQKKAIVEFVTNNSWFILEEVEDEEDEENYLSFATRKHGDIVEELFGKEDYIEAKRIIRELLSKFPKITVYTETCDEWVMIKVYY